jgi:hypothetical protein
MTAYDAAYQQQYGVRAPIEPAKDTALAKKLLARYTVDELTDWLGVFMRHPDPFIQGSGHTFGVFYKCLGKCITAPRPTRAEPPPAPLVELAKSIARANQEEAERGREEIAQWTQRLMDRGMSADDAKFHAGRDWLHAQRTRTR